MKKSGFRLLVVLLILLIFPFISWYYLRSGLDYRMDAISEFEEFGQFSWIDSYDERGRYISASRFDQKYIVAGVAPLDDEDLNLFSSRFVGIIEQFSSRDEVLYLNIFNREVSNSSEFANQLYDAYRGTNLNHIVVGFSNEEIDGLLNNWAAQSGLDESQLRQKLYLIDENGTVIQYYNFYEEDRIGRLIEHLSMQFTASQNRRDYSDAIRKRL